MARLHGCSTWSESGGWTYDQLVSRCKRQSSDHRNQIVWTKAITAVNSFSRQLQPTPSLVQPTQTLADLGQVHFDRFEFLASLIAQQQADFPVEFFAQFVQP